jgi:hypothetical protein
MIYERKCKMSLSENELNAFMEEVKIEIRKAPKMFAQLQSRDKLIKDLKQQRDDLLEAGKDVLATFVGYVEGSIAGQVLKNLDAAMAKCQT